MDYRFLTKTGPFSWKAVNFAAMPLETPKENLNSLLQGLSPALHEGAFVFCQVPVMPMGVVPIAMFREAEGVTMILPLVDAQALKLKYDGVFAWLTLQQHTSLFAVGITAAVSAALSESGICANVVAAFSHDHIFVPYTRGHEAVQLLQRLTN
jgi:uncharacterized protein